MLNNVVLMGRLTRDPEIRTTPSYVTVAAFTLAVGRDFSRIAEQKQTDFINIVTFRKTAEFVSKYFKKGQQVCVLGRIQTRSWEGPDGKKRFATDIVAEKCYFEEPKNGGSGMRGNEDSTPVDGFAPPFDDDDNLPF